MAHRACYADEVLSPERKEFMAQDIRRELFLKAMDILNTPSIDYPKRMRRILYLMKDYNTDDEPLGLK